MAFIWIEGTSSRAGHYIVVRPEDKEAHAKTGVLPTWFTDLERGAEASPCAQDADAPLGRAQGTATC